MATEFNTQIGNGEYNLQFSTTDKDKYRLMETAARMCTDGKDARLRELAQAEKLLGETVYEPNKRGFISTYKIIAFYISKCSIFCKWELLDGVYSNLNGFEISAIGKTVFLTREAAEAAPEERNGAK